MTYCELCKAIDSAKTKETEEGADDEGIQVCSECGGEECFIRVPEHDDYDIER